MISTWRKLKRAYAEYKEAAGEEKFFWLYLLETIAVALQDEAYRLRQHEGCVFCGDYVFENYMLEDDLWMEVVGNPEALAHLRCVMMKLATEGKPRLQAKDFTSAPVNYLFWIGFAVGKNGAVDFQDLEIRVKSDE